MKADNAMKAKEPSSRELGWENGWAETGHASFYDGFRFIEDISFLDFARPTSWANLERPLFA